jgi:oxygen-independent coproporphyrinogen-3 oxidase
LAFGVRATSFVNNVRVYFCDDIDKYYHMLDNHEFPVFKGYKNNKDDSLRSYVIKYFQANQGIVKKVIEDAYGIDFDSYFVKELNKLREMEEDGLITMDDDIINLTQKGKIYITNILMVFDQYPNWKEIFQFKSEEAETA